MGRLEATGGGGGGGGGGGLQELEAGKEKLQLDQITTELTLSQRSVHTVAGWNFQV